MPFSALLKGSLDLAGAMALSSRLRLCRVLGNPVAFAVVKLLAEKPARLLSAQTHLARLKGSTFHPPVVVEWDIRQESQDRQQRLCCK
jgi:hypothetical protein